MSEPFDLTRHPAHLARGAITTIEPEFTADMQWYADYGQRHQTDGLEGRLVSMHSFASPWDHWERHPHGSELVLCIHGTITLHQDIDGTTRTVHLEPGHAIINQPGTWHTADVDAPATVLFITAGVGTEHRSRHPTARSTRP